MDAADLLESAWGFIDTPGKWVKGQYSRPNHKGGMSYCSLGAIGTAMNTVGRPEAKELDRAMLALAGSMRGMPLALDRTQDAGNFIIAVNDGEGTTHDKLKQYWFDAIRSLRGPENMDIKEIDVETTHEPLESPVPGKRETAPAREVPAVPSLPAPVKEPVEV